MKKKGKILALMLASIMSTSLVASSGVFLTGCNNNDNPPVTKDDQLASPATLTYADGKLTWGAVANATSYEVTVTPKDSTTVSLKQTVTATELSVSSLANGEYTASVVAKADGYTASAAKTANFTVGASQELQALPTPTGFAYSNGKVTWTAVTGAEAGYLVKVTKKSDNSVAIAEKTVTVTELDVSALAAGEYSLSVTAKAVEGKHLASLPAAYAFTVEAVKETLATPAGGAVDVANRKVTWNAVENAEEYNITIKVEGEDDVKETVTAAEFNLANVVEQDSFTLIVVAKAADYTDSQPYTFNATITAVALEKVTDIQIDTAKTVLSWKHEAGDADHYRVVVKKDGATALDKNVITADEKGVYSLDVSELGVGSYAAEVYAIADGFDVFRNDSAAQTFSFDVQSMGNYEAVENIRIDGANIVWDENNAVAYEIVVTAKGGGQALDIKGVKAVGESFNFLATRLPKGDYTISITPKDTRHTGEGTAATYDVALKNLKSFDAEAIAGFDGETSNGGEHGKVELITKDGVKRAKVMPTADGWGRVRSEDFVINYDRNPLVVIDVAEVIIGGYHLEVAIGGEKYKIIRDSQIVGGSIAKFVPERENEEGKPAGIKGLQQSYLRLGVDHSTENSLNNAETHFTGVSIWYLNEWEEPISGNLDEVTGYEISNGMDITWNGVNNADAYRVTLVKKGATEAENETIITKFVQSGVSYRSRDLAEGEYTISVSAFNSDNELLIEADETSYSFKVAYLKEYSTQDILKFVNICGDSQRVDYDKDADAAIIDPEASGWGVMAAPTNNAVTLNLTNRPFAYVDVVSITGTAQNAGYISRGKYTPAGEESEQEIILRNDTPTKSSDDWYIELWKKANQNNAPVTGTASYRFGVGFINGATVRVKSIRIVEITEITDLIHGAKDPLSAPSNVTEDKGLLRAETVKGNSEYTPTYSVTVTEKDTSTPVYNQTNLSAPEVNLAALGLTNAKTYTVTFKAIGDNDYFVDSPAYTVEVEYKAVTLLDSFAGVDFTTYADRNGGTEVDGVRYPVQLTNNPDGSLSATTKNGYWDFNFMALDLSDIIDSIDRDYYMELLVDGEKSTAGATIATRFTVRASDGTIASGIRDTGYGETPAGDVHLTKEWRDVISNDNTFGFAIGHGGNTISGDVTEKTIVYTGIRFVKFIIKTNAD